MTQTWEEAQKWEQEWHGNCVNSLNEELKQLVYAKKMGIRFTPDLKTPYNIDLEGKSIFDIGGGAYSLLLKASNFRKAVVVEPIDHPEWVMKRYEEANIRFWNIPGEEISLPPEADPLDKPDEVWMYNVLQHTQDPEKIIQNIKKMGKLLRIFEWVDIPVTSGHLHTLTEANLNTWIGGEGKVEFVKEMGCVGKCYYGIFPL